MKKATAFWVGVKCKPHFCPEGAMTMASVEHEMTAVYVFVDDYLKAHPNATQWRRAHNNHPAFSDAEVITVGLLRDEGAYFGKSSTGWFFGFKLHVLIHDSGVILATLLTPGNWADLCVAPALAQSISGGIALADLGYQGEELFEHLVEEAAVCL